MRIERLHLLRYGSLTDRELRFRPGAGLHLVYGPNEAGKSSALAAICDLLFGFSEKRRAADGAEERRYDFLHEAPSLRVCATLVDAGGTRLSLRRRKGRKNTLLADDEGEAPLPDDALAPFLGGLTREVFQLAFGLDSARLREGGRLLLAGDGEGGEIFAAASGLHGLNALRADLDREADGLFAPRASSARKIYQVLERHDAARREERERQLREGEWKALNKAVETASEALAGAEARLSEAHARRERLTRLVSLKPLLARIEVSKARLAAFADLAGVPRGLARRLEAALAAAAMTVEAQRDAARRLGEAEVLARAITVDGALIAAAGDVTALHAEIGAFRQRQRDIPRVTREARDLSDALGAQLRRLGLALEPKDSDAIRARQPTDAALADLAARLAEGEDLRRARVDLAATLEEERAAFERLSAGTGDTLPADPAPLRARLAALAPPIRLLEERDRLLPERQRLARRLAETAARLTPPVAEPERLAAAPLPSLELIGEHRLRFEEIGEALRRHREQEAAWAEDLARLDAAIAESERGGDMPSRTRIDAARRERDDALARIPDEGAPALEVAQPLLREADHLADRAIAEADRVSRHAADVARREALLERRAEATPVGARLSADLAAAKEAWAALFAPLALAPAGPTAMTDWRKSVERWLEQHEELAELISRIDDLETRSARAVPGLAALAGELGLAVPAPGDPAGDGLALLRLVEGELERRTDAFQQGRALAARLGDAAARLDRLTREAGAIEQALANWRQGFNTALAGAGLDPGASPEAAGAALEVWRALPAALTERDKLARRVRGMQRDNEAFSTAALDLLHRVAPSLAEGAAGEEPDRLVEALQRRLAEERAALTRAEGAGEALARARTELARADERQAGAATQLSDLCGDLPEALRAGDMALLAARLAERDGLAATLDEALGLFAETAAGEPREVIAGELADLDDGAAQAGLERLAGEIEALTAGMKEALAALHAAVAERERAEAGEGADRAAFERLAAEAELQDLGRQWLVTRLASLLLSAGLERHRARQDDPLLEHAGRLFADLTSGSFDGLTRRFGEDDRAELLARRPEGATVGLVGLSDGTCDQLYLALRLAFLTDYATRAEAAPFIGDDLFQTFDDARTAAGLRTLAGLSDTMQPILFTHHASVVDIARRELGERLDLLEM